MERVPVDLSGARVLLTNDDGIDAEGFRIMEAALQGVVGELWVSAPAEGHSGASAMVSLRRSVEIQERAPRRFAVTGRPADSVLAALRVTMADHPPDLILSGINHGVNLGGDLLFSGTIGAAAVGRLNGIPSIALSADHPPEKPVTSESWASISQVLGKTLRTLCGWGFPSGAFYGVNFPVQMKNTDPLLCRQGDVGDTMYFKPDDTAVEGTGKRYILHHAGGATGAVSGTDYGAIQAGRIAVTPITLDRTDHALLQALAEAI